MFSQVVLCIKPTGEALHVHTPAIFSKCTTGALPTGNTFLIISETETGLVHHARVLPFPEDNSMQYIVEDTYLKPYQSLIKMTN